MNGRELLEFSESLASILDEIRDAARADKGTESASLLSNIAQGFLPIVSAFRERAMGRSGEYDPKAVEQIKYQIAELLEDSSLRPSTTGVLFSLRGALAQVART